MKQLIAACAVLVTLTTSAGAKLLVAVVEDAQGKVTGAEFMDYLAPATVIEIGDGGSIVISYMTSCRREKISGIGTVIVGTQESVVHLAEVKSEKTACDSRQTYMTTRATSEAAATVLRSAALPKPQLTLYGASPLVEAKGGGTLVLQRLDVAGEREQVDLDGTQLKGKFFDFAIADRVLAPGGLYAATFKSSKVIFQVDPQAKPGTTPIVGRLLRME